MSSFAFATANAVGISTLTPIKADYTSELAQVDSALPEFTQVPAMQLAQVEHSKRGRGKQGKGRGRSMGKGKKRGHSKSSHSSHCSPEPVSCHEPEPECPVDTPDCPVDPECEPTCCPTDPHCEPEPACHEPASCESSSSCRPRRRRHRRPTIHNHYHYTCPAPTEEEAEPTLNPVCDPESIIYNPTSLACVCDPNSALYDEAELACKLTPECTALLPDSLQDLTDPAWLLSVGLCICQEDFPGYIEMNPVCQDDD